MKKIEQMFRPFRIIKRNDIFNVYDNLGSLVYSTDNKSEATYLRDACNNYERLKKENERLREALQKISVFKADWNVHPISIPGYMQGIAEKALKQSEK